MESRRHLIARGNRREPRRRVSALWLASLLGIWIAGGMPAGEAAETRRERVLPRFSGPVLGGGIGSTDSIVGRRGLIYAFATTDHAAPEMAELVRRVTRDTEEANIAVLVVNRDLEPERVQPFVNLYLEDLPVILDQDLSITRKLGVPPGKSAVYVIDADGYIIAGLAYEPEGVPDPSQAYESELRRILHLEPLDQSTRPLLGTSPPAPGFEVQSLRGAKASLEELRGKVIALVFFLPSCPHCHEALQFLDGLKRKPEYEDLEVISVSIRDRPFLIREMREDLELEIPLYVDPEASAQQAYEHRLGVPDTVLIDRSARIVGRFGGISPRIKAIISMELRQALGIPNPILLSRSEYSGSEMCQACHRQQHSSWLLTRHAHAYDTLLEHGEERNSECIGCHSVGWGQPGGYALDQPLEHLESVQCENCHGRGGPHQSPDFLAEKGGYPGVCADCHTATHSLNFVFSERLPEVSHAAQFQFTKLSLEQRRALLEKREHRQRSLFHAADYVGSRACADCHSREFALWQKTPHARALETLAAQERSDSTECQRCHTTGFEAAGGFPSGGEALGGVGCESCHGPGGAHVARDARRSGTILALTDKCDGCVILQICGSCHDDANDPGFEFELEEKLERIRHGSAPAGSAAE
ncbi:MAG: multiheme c-type cytochrome [Myxococcota bacterium]|nr:multiheme c-type cytochrome [Myxococcota bacterium]